MQPSEAQKTPQQHAHHIASLLQQAQQECRSDIDRVDDPRAQALFETLAEVLGGATKALSDYQEATERAWQPVRHPPTSENHGPTVSDLRVDVSAAAPPPRLTQEMPPETWGGQETRE